MNAGPAIFEPYPFERLRLLFKDIAPDARCSAICLGIGEPVWTRAGGLGSRVWQSARG